ncbi:MAG: hypothetical protein ACOYL6_04205 [Bacteriovoracaceae bacterium]
MTDNLGHWVSILDYAHLKGKSISTIRRSIKANLLKYKQEDGKYYIYCNGVKTHPQTQGLNRDELVNENIRLKNKINELTEENSELCMLIKLYEEKSQLTFNFPNPPEVPSEQ